MTKAGNYKHFIITMNDEGLSLKTINREVFCEKSFQIKRRRNSSRQFQTMQDSLLLQFHQNLIHPTVAQN